jgi:hypothetical protein
MRNTVLVVDDRPDARYSLGHPLATAGFVRETATGRDALRLARLQETGFEIEIYEEPPDWQSQHRALVEGIIAAETQLAEEVGSAAAAGLVAMARGVLAELPVRRYVFVVARRR